jgi:methionyl-tRNA formyltransferase
MRAVFMGSPEFALPSLEALAAHYSVVGVVTQPDRPAGRGRKLQPSAVKTRALALGLPVLEPERVRAEAAVEQLNSLDPELIVVAAFGQILPASLLAIPARGCLNVHASLLPRWRGAAPIQAAILHGDETSGVTIMRMDVGLDTGPILAQGAAPIQPQETGGALSGRLATLGAKLLLDTLPPYLDGKLQPQPQDETLATLAPMLKKADGQLDVRREAEWLARQVRAYEPWPGSFLDLQQGRLLVRRAHSVPSEGGGQPPGTLAMIAGFPAVYTGVGLLVLDLVQLPGKRPMSGEAYLRGASQFLNADLVRPTPH